MLIKNQDQVKKNQSCFVLESMKMEFDIKSTAAGVVSKVFIKEGEQVTRKGFSQTRCLDLHFWGIWTGEAFKSNQRNFLTFS